MAKRAATHLRSHLVPYVALFFALTIGTAWAATAPKNSVTSKSIKNGQVKTRDLAKKSVTNQKLAKGAVTASKVKSNTLTGAQIKESSLDPGVLQRRVSGTCAAGQTIQAVKSDGSVTCLSNGGPPTGPAGGELTGTYPDPAIASGAVSTAKLADGAVTDAKVAAANKDGAVGTPSMRTLGTGAQQAMAGNATPGGTPSGAAGGALKGAYPNPTLNVTGGPCANGRALTNVSSGAALTCAPGVYSDAHDNVAAGPTSFPAPTIGTANSALGQGALASLTFGDYNSALGHGALQDNTSGGYNSAFGNAALGSNTFGLSNSAFGLTALLNNTSGSQNSAFGKDALYNNTTGDSNLAIGEFAGSAVTDGDDNIEIANVGVAGDSATTRIGQLQSRAFIAGVFNASTGGTASQVLVNNQGQLGTTSSSRRFKRDVQPLDRASRRLMQLNPVSFRYKRSYVHGRSSLQFGLLAEQVAKVYPNLVVRGRDGRPSAVAYQELPALLLAQAQRQKARSDSQKGRADRQQARIDRQQRQIASLRSRNVRVRHLQAQVRWLMRQTRSG